MSTDYLNGTPEQPPSGNVESYILRDGKKYTSSGAPYVSPKEITAKAASGSWVSRKSDGVRDR